MHLSPPRDTAASTAQATKASAFFVRPTPERKEPKGRMRRQGRRRRTPEGQGSPASPPCWCKHKRGCAEREESPWPHPSSGLDKRVNQTYD